MNPARTSRADRVFEWISLVRVLPRGFLRSHQLFVRPSRALEQRMGNMIAAKSHEDTQTKLQRPMICAPSAFIRPSAPSSGHHTSCGSTIQQRGRRLKSKLAEAGDFGGFSVR